jgi:GxxExxY protein
MDQLLHGEITDRILRCAVSVHRELGPGLAEHSYQTALEIEMAEAGLSFVREQPIAVRYKGVVVGWHRPDFIVAGLVVVELKAVSAMDPVFAKQVLTYLRVTGLRVGLLLNFNVASIGNQGIKRYQI